MEWPERGRNPSVNAGFRITGIISCFSAPQIDSMNQETNPLSKPTINRSETNEEDDLLCKKARQFIRMRWGAAATGIFCIYLAFDVFSFLSETALYPLLGMIGGVILFNLASLWMLNTQPVKIRNQLMIQVVGDLFLLTGLLHFSGGVENPFLYLYLIHVILASILFRQPKAWTISGLSILLATLMTAGEYAGLIAHYDLTYLAHESGVNPATNPNFAGATILTLSLLIVLLTYFTTAVMEELRSSRKKAVDREQTVSREKKKFETVLKALGAGVMLYDEDLNLVWNNQKVEEWFPETSFETGRSCPFLHDANCTLRVDRSGSREEPEPDADEPRTEACRRCNALDSFQEGERSEREQIYVTPDGTKKYFQFIGYPIQNEGGEVERVVELIHDVTERKRMEEQIEHRERMSTLGRLASGITHEIGNPLSSISARLRRMKQKTEEEFTKETAEFLSEQISRLNRLIRDISSFAQSSAPAWEPCRPEHLIEETVRLLEMDKNSNNVEIETDVPSDVPHFLASRDQLNQIFLNLGLNALEAMPDGGTLTISVSYEEEEIQFSFADTGKGIPPDLQSEIFTPYFSTEDVEEGTGLGLSIVDTLVQAHGGEVNVSSVPGEGSTFTVRIPYHDPSSSNRSASTNQTSVIESS